MTQSYFFESDNLGFRPFAEGDLDDLLLLDATFMFFDTRTDEFIDRAGFGDFLRKGKMKGIQCVIYEYKL